MRKLLVLPLLLVAAPAAADDFKIQPGAFGGPPRLSDFKSDDSEAPVAPGIPAAGGKARVKYFDPRKMQPDAPPPTTLSSGPMKERETASFKPPEPPPEDAPEVVPEVAPDPVKAKARVTEYMKGLENPNQEKPVRWRFLALGLLGTLLSIPILRVAWRRFTHEHQLEGASGSVPADIAAQRRDLGSAERLIPISDKALNVVRRAGSWVTTSRVATQIGVEPEEAEQLLTILEEEGRVERQLDDQGRPQFRFLGRS